MMRQLKSILMMGCLLVTALTLTAQVRNEIKGTWILVGIDDQLNTDTVRLLQQDKVFIRTLQTRGIPYTTRWPISGSNNIYNAFHNQFMTFDKDHFGCGFAEDSTFKKKKALRSGTCTLTDSSVFVSLIFTRMPDGQFYMADFGITYGVKVKGSTMMLTTPGAEMTYYFRRISTKAIFR